MGLKEATPERTTRLFKAKSTADLLRLLPGELLACEVADALAALSLQFLLVFLSFSLLLSLGPVPFAILV